MAARWIVAVSQAAGGPVFPSQRFRSSRVMVRSCIVRVACFLLRLTHPSARLQDETAKIEDELLKPASLDALLKCFVSAKAVSFENLLDPFLKICRSSNLITLGVAKSQFFKRIIDRLNNNSKAVVRLNLLRILRTVCDAHPNRAVLVERFGIYDIVVKLSKEDGAVLVRELAREILPSLAPAIKPLISSRFGRADTSKSSVAPKKLKSQRTVSESAVSPPLFTSNHARNATGGRESTEARRLPRQASHGVSRQLTEHGASRQQ